MKAFMKPFCIVMLFAASDPYCHGTEAYAAMSWKRAQAVEKNQGRIAAWRAKKQAEKAVSQLAEERLRRRLVRERMWSKIADGFSKRVAGGGIGRAVTGIGIIGVGLAVFLCTKGALGCGDEDDTKQKTAR